MENDYQKACRHNESSDVLKKLGMNKHYLYQVTGLKTTVAGNQFDVQGHTVVALSRDFGQHETIKEMCLNAGGLFLSSDDLKDLDIDQQLTALTKLSVVLGIANKLKG